MSGRLRSDVGGRRAAGGVAARWARAMGMRRPPPQPPRPSLPCPTPPTPPANPHLLRACKCSNAATTPCQPRPAENTARPSPATSSSRARRWKGSRVGVRARAAMGAALPPSVGPVSAAAAEWGAGCGRRSKSPHSLRGHAAPRYVGRRRAAAMWSPAGSGGGRYRRRALGRRCQAGRCAGRAARPTRLAGAWLGVLGAWRLQRVCCFDHGRRRRWGGPGAGRATCAAPARARPAPTPATSSPPALAAPPAARRRLALCPTDAPG